MSERGVRYPDGFLIAEDIAFSRLCELKSLCSITVNHIQQQKITMKKGGAAFTRPVEELKSSPPEVEKPMPSTIPTPTPSLGSQGEAAAATGPPEGVFPAQAGVSATAETAQATGQPPLVPGETGKDEQEPRPFSPYKAPSGQKKTPLAGEAAAKVGFIQAEGKPEEQGGEQEDTADW